MSERALVMHVTLITENHLPTIFFLNEENEMTPTERAIAALERRIPEGLVPHLELEYQLTEEVFGRKALRSGDLEGVTGQKRKDMLKCNAELWIDVAKTYDWSVIRSRG